MRKLLVYMKGYRTQAILAPLFKLTEVLFELFVPLVVASIIDNGIGENNKGYVIKGSILMAVLGIVGFICAVIAQYFAAKAAVGFATKLRLALFEKINSFTFNNIDKIGTSTLIMRLTGDVNQVQTGVNLTLRLLLRSPFIVFGAMIMAFTVDSKSALTFAFAILLLSIIIVTIMAITIPLHKRVQQKLEVILLKTREALKGVRVLRAFCKENMEIKEFSETNSNLTISQKFVGKISALMNPLTYVVVNLAIISIIWIGGKRVYSGNLSSGSIVALYNYMSQILIELVKLATMIVTLNKSLASCSRIEKIMSFDNTTTKTTSKKKRTDNYIEFANVSFKYDDAGESSLNNINFTVKKGEHIGIIGPTGSGKSTLVNLIPAFYTATDGTIYVDGKDVKSYSEKKLFKMIGMVFQKSVLFKGSIKENLLLGGKKATNDQLISALKTAQAFETVNSKGGLDAKIEQGGKNLSGGQKQRLSIARALVGNPEILILDDSASALDFATEAALRKALNKLSYKPTIFTVSQRVSSVMHSDKIIVLEDGKIVGIGTHDELYKNCELYMEICNTQLNEEDLK